MRRLNCQILVLHPDNKNWNSDKCQNLQIRMIHLSRFLRKQLPRIDTTGAHSTTFCSWNVFHLFLFEMKYSHWTILASWKKWKSTSYPEKHKRFPLKQLATVFLPRGVVWYLSEWKQLLVFQILLWALCNWSQINRNCQSLENFQDSSPESSSILSETTFGF